MAKVQKSIRLDGEIYERLEAAAKEGGESVNATIEKAIGAGLDFLEGAQVSRSPEEEPAPSGIAADFIESLKSQISTLEAQLEIKDGQIAALNEQAVTLQRLTDQAQQLHAATEAKALETAEAKRKRGRFSAWIFGE